MKPHMLCLAAFAALVLSAVAQQPQTQQATAPKQKEEKSSVEAVNEAAPGLPRVLVLGDSVCRGYTPALGAGLAGKAAVYHSRKLAGATSKGLEKIDGWLVGKRWDVIHFNFGIADMEDLEHTGAPKSTPAQYEENLRALVVKLKASGAKLIWATTTPIPKELGTVDEYNAIAARIMAESGIAVDDLHAVILPHVAEYRLPKDVHYNDAGYALLGQTAASSIEAVLAGR